MITLQHLRTLADFAVHCTEDEFIDIFSELYGCEQYHDFVNRYKRDIIRYIWLLDFKNRQKIIKYINENC